MRLVPNRLITRVIIIVLGLFWVYVVYAATQTVVSAIRMSANHEQTRVVLSVNGPVRYKVFTLPHPERAVLDIENTRLATKIPTPPSHSPIKDIRSSTNGQRLRLVFDLKQELYANALILHPKNNQGYRLVLDLSMSSNSAFTETVPNPKSVTSSGTGRATVAPAPQSSSTKREAANSGSLNLPIPAISYSEAQGQRDVIVVIDPGHGGKDPGTTGHGGVHEKTVVLAISKYLQQMINAQPGMHAVLTRNGDYYITLRDRLNIAREDKGDIFVAIHADAYKDNSATGASVYALSQRGATSEAARWLAEKENYSELGGVNLDDKSYVLRSVLIDLSQTATIGSSLQLGADVLGSIGKIAPLHYTHVEQARFVVLKSPDIPSILIETGFLSNASQARLLSNSNYQKKMAQAIMKGIQNYFYQTPPPGTWFAAHRKNANQYRVMRGDTVSSIADHFNISVASLRQSNNIKGNNISVGQVLKIPQG